MKKFLLTLLVLMSFGFVANAAGTDVLTSESLYGGTKNSQGYKPFESGVFESGAQYAGKLSFAVSKGNYYFALNNGNSNASDLVTIKSGGVAKTVTIKWSTAVSTANGRTVKVYGKHSAYTSGDKAQGTEIGSCSKGAAASETITLTDQTFEFVAISSASAVNIEEITIEWAEAEQGGSEEIELEQGNLIISSLEETYEDEGEYYPAKNTEIVFSYNTDNKDAAVAISYSVNGGDFKDGSVYVFSGEDDVILTVKAASANEISKTIYLYKWYPTECPKPEFSIKDGAEVYVGQVITVSCDGAEELYLEVNEELLDGCTYTVSGNTGDTVTLHALASVTGRNGAIEEEVTITVVIIERSESTFDFSNSGYGLTAQTSSSKYETEVTEISEGIVIINFDGDKYRYWNSDKTLRVQSGTTFTVSVPNEYYITSIDFSGTSASNVSVGTLNNGNWNPGDNMVSSVKFSPTTTTKIKTITVKYALRPTIKGLRCEIDRVFKNTAYFNYMLHVDNHNGDESGSEYNVVLTVNGEDFQGEHSLMNAASAPRRELSENDVPSTHTFVGKVGAQGLEGLTPYTASLRVEHNGNVVAEHTINDIQFETTNTTGIEDVAVDGNEAAEYFNLQGVRVAQPEAGQIYIVRRGAKVVKELVK